MYTQTVNQPSLTLEPLCPSPLVELDSMRYTQQQIDFVEAMRRQRWSDALCIPEKAAELRCGSDTIKTLRRCKDLECDWRPDRWRAARNAKDDALYAMLELGGIEGAIGVGMTALGSVALVPNIIAAKAAGDTALATGLMGLAGACAMPLIGVGAVLGGAYCFGAMTGYDQAPPNYANHYEKAKKRIEAKGYYIDDFEQPELESLLHQLQQVRGIVGQDGLSVTCQTLITRLHLRLDRIRQNDIRAAKVALRFQ